MDAGLAGAHSSRRRQRAIARDVGAGAAGASGGVGAAPRAEAPARGPVEAAATGSALALAPLGKRRLVGRTHSSMARGRRRWPEACRAHTGEGGISRTPRRAHSAQNDCFCVGG